MIDYNQIHQDLLTLVSGGTYTDEIANFYIEADDREATFSHMPFFNIRLIQANIELRSIPNGYYGILTFEIDCVAFDLSEFRVAAVMRDRLLKECQLVIQGNSLFSGSIQTSIIGPEVKFISGTPEGANGHVAAATFGLSVEVSIEPT
jgi:hypothetical protein